jgi:hypothetical protein
MSCHKTSFIDWHAKISELGLTHRPTCILFNKQEQLQQVPFQQQQNDKCGCGRLKKSHSYEGQPKSRSDEKWNSESCSNRIEDMKNCGVLYNPYESRLTKVKTIYFRFVEVNVSFRLVYSL